MAIDFRGHGESEASLTSIGFHESRDVEAGMRYIRGTGSGDPVLWGTSMGAVSALLAAERDGSVAGLIADAPFDTYRNTICHHAKLMYGIPEFPLIVLACPMIEERAHFRMDDVNSLRAAAKIHAPMLVLAGEKDVRMDSAVVRSVYEAAAGPKEFWVSFQERGTRTERFRIRFRKRYEPFWLGSGRAEKVKRERGGLGRRGPEVRVRGGDHLCRHGGRSVGGRCDR